MQETSKELKKKKKVFVETSKFSILLFIWECLSAGIVPEGIFPVRGSRGRNSLCCPQKGLAKWTQKTRRERKELFQGKKPSLAPLVSPGKRLADHTGGLAWHQSLAGKAFKHECLKITDEDTNYGFAWRLAPFQRGNKDKAPLTCSLATAFRTLC